MYAEIADISAMEANMTAQQAVVLRIKELMKEKKLTINKLAELSGVHHSTLDAMLSLDSTIKNTGVTTIKRLCQGMGISFSKFWKSKLFDNLDYEE